MIFGPRARHFALAGLTIVSTLSTIAACNALLGVEDVTLRKSKDTGTDEDEDGLAPGPADAEEAPTERPNVFQAALGEQHSCARKPAGTVRCWGDDTQGQTGSGGPADAGFVSSPRDVDKIADAIDLAAGGNHTCVAHKIGSVSCWGENRDGQLGNGESNNIKPTPVAVKDLTGAIAVAAGGDFSCAIRSGGAVSCWGGNASGQLGRGDQSPSTTPVPVASLSGAVAIAAGQAHACTVTGDGKVHCWGDGTSGQLGSGTPTGSSKPVVVESLPEAAMISAGAHSTCALTKTGSVFCWGANELGQLGSGAPNPNPNPSPIVVTNLADVVAISSGQNHTCAARKTGVVVCWGAGSRGQLGDGQARLDAGGAQASFVTVSRLESAINVGAGGAHSCAPTKGDRLVCWGANDRGQLGNGSVTSELSPVSATGYP